MDSFPAMSLGRLEKNLDDWDNSSTFSQASLDSQLKGFRLTCEKQKCCDEGLLAIVSKLPQSVNGVHMLRCKTLSISRHRLNTPKHHVVEYGTTDSVVHLRA